MVLTRAHNDLDADTRMIFLSVNIMIKKSSFFFLSNNLAKNAHYRLKLDRSDDAIV